MDRDTKSLENTPETWKALGNQHFKDKNYDLALEAYNKGLRLQPNHTALLSNRCLINLNMENFKEALSDAEEVLRSQPNHENAIRRKMMSFIGLRKYEDAVKFLECLNPQQNSREMIEIKSKLSQQLLGIYDFDYFLCNENDRNTMTYSICAEYHAQTKLVEIPGKGRGLTSKEEIKAGQLIMASKALIFDYALSKDRHLLNESELDEDYLVDFMNIACLAAEKLARKPDLRKEFLTLYAGPELGHLSEAEAQSCDELDPDRIVSICQYNRFEGNFLEHDKEPYSTNSVPSGIWLWPSFLNHSCVSYNAFWMIKKDLLFVRAVEDIKEGQEITIPYISFDPGCKIRRQSFRERGFECTCDLCLLEKREPESTHTAREAIFEMINSLPVNVPLTDQQVEQLEAYGKQMDILRPESNLNFPRRQVHHKLAEAYLLMGKPMKSAEIMAKDYDMFGRYAHPSGLSSAVNCVTCYLAAGMKEEAIQWIAKWKEQLYRLYGSDKVNIYPQAKELLKKMNMDF